LRLSFVISACIFILLYSSCKRECDYVPVSVLSVRFYTIANNNEVTTSIDSLLAYPVGIEDSILYDWSKNVNAIRLPLAPHWDHSSFVLRLNEFTDTVQLFYQRQLYFVSEECGFSMNFKIDSIFSTYNKIDSVSIIQPSVQVINEEHLRIFF
jgi:hypothetical protein